MGLDKVLGFPLGCKNSNCKTGEIVCRKGLTGWVKVKCVGILRCAQDDSKNNTNSNDLNANGNISRIVRYS